MSDWTFQTSKAVLGQSVGFRSAWRTRGDAFEKPCGMQASKQLVLSLGIKAAGLTCSQTTALNERNCHRTIASNCNCKLLYKQLNICMYNMLKKQREQRIKNDNGWQGSFQWALSSLSSCLNKSSVLRFRGWRTLPFTLKGRHAPWTTLTGRLCGSSAPSCSLPLFKNPCKQAQAEAGMAPSVPSPSSFKNCLELPFLLTEHARSRMMTMLTSHNPDRLPGIEPWMPTWIRVCVPPALSTIHELHQSHTSYIP